MAHVPGKVHGDLKAVSDVPCWTAVLFHTGTQANVLVARDGTPMLTDFGNASLADSTVAFTATIAASFSLRWTVCYPHRSRTGLYNCL